MVKTKEYRPIVGETILCETYSSIGADLHQEETGSDFGSSVIDTIDHYENGFPVSRFTYTEVGVDPDEVTPEELMSELEAML